MLKYKKENVVEVSDWDELVEKTYGRPYNFQQQDYCKSRGVEYFEVPRDNYLDYDYDNDTIPEVVNGYEMGVSFKAWLARDPELLVEDCAFSTRLFWERNFYPSLDMVANDLYEKGLIEAGSYMIVIDW